MALKVGGVAVVNDSRELTNITNIKTVNGASVLGAGDITIPTYSHPANHPASVITQDASNRFVTDTEKATWNAKLGSVKTINGQSIVGSGDIAVGSSSFFATDISVNSLTVGRGAGNNSSNASLGFNALRVNSSGNQNTAVGMDALYSTTSGAGNTAIGTNTLRSNSTGNNNTAVGLNALNSTGSSWNVAVGYDSARTNTGQANCAVGTNSLNAVSGNTGSNNTVLGTSAGTSITSGSGNVVIGSVKSDGYYGPAFDITNQNNHVVIGSNVVTNAYIKVAWTVVSDARDKINFAPVPHGLEFVKQLKPTAYQFRESRESDATNGGVRYGFKAQDIAAIEPEAVIVDTTNPEKLYYNESNLIAVLVKAVQELSDKNDALQARIQALESAS